MNTRQISTPSSRPAKPKKPTWLALVLGILVAFPAFGQTLALRPQETWSPAPCGSSVIPQLRCLGKEDEVKNGIKLRKYNLEVTNWSEYPESLFEASPDLPPCGLNENASRTWVRIRDEHGNQLMGFCAFTSPEELTTLYFKIAEGEPQPDYFVVELHDRLCDKTLTSAPLTRYDCHEAPPADLVAPLFRRGDASNDASVSLEDAILVLTYLLIGGAEISCQDAADADDNGRIELNDSILILANLFLGLEPPAPPGPKQCGYDPSEDGLDRCFYRATCSKEDAAAAQLVGFGTLEARRRETR